MAAEAAKAGELAIECLLLGGGTIHDDNATPRVISPARVPGDAEELPNGDLSRSLFSVGVSGDVAAGVPGVSAGGYLVS